MADLSNVRQALVAGLARFSFSVYDDDGELAPFSGGSIVKGSAAGSGGMRRIKGARSIPLGFVQEQNTVNWDGDDGYIDSVLFDNAAAPEAIGVFAEFDMDVVARLQTSSVTQYGDMAAGARLTKDPEFPTICAIVQSTKSKSRKGGLAEGLPIAKAYVIINATMAPLGVETIDQLAVHDDRYKLTLGKRSTSPWGTTINDDFSTCATGVIELNSEYPIDIVAWKGNAAALTFNFPLTPAAANGDKVVVWVDGVLQTYTTHYTVNTTAKTITFVGAPADDAYVVALYQFSAGCS
jgi:hypothetical protein